MDLHEILSINLKDLRLIYELRESDTTGSNAPALAQSANDINCPNNLSEDDDEILSSASNVNCSGRVKKIQNMIIKMLYRRK